VFSKEKEDEALRVDHEIKFSVIGDANSFLFEVNACTDLMQKFFGLLHAHVGDTIVDISLGRPEAVFLMENLKTLDDPGKFFSNLRSAGDRRRFQQGEGCFTSPPDKAV
jgi:hypothetical protein